MANSTGSFGALLRAVACIAAGVKSLKKKAKVESVWSMESVTLPKTGKFQEVARISEAVDPVKLEGRILDVVLVTVGLGNKHDMNFYGPEAIKSGIEAFEGADCYLNHPTESDKEDIPERRVEDKCGYYKNLRVEEVKDLELGLMVEALVGELHLDLSQTGELAYGKIKTAIHYRSEFPGSHKEYVGLSVNADGNAEERTMTIEGMEQDVNYVTQFIKSVHTSCDLVTSPARGGRFNKVLAEDAAGSGTESMREANVNKLKKKLQTALATLKAIESEKDEANKVKKLAEAQKIVAEAEAEASEAEILGLETFGKQTGESDAAHKTRLGKMASALKKEMEAYAEADDKSEDESKDAEDDEDDEKDAKKDMESSRLAVKQLISEAKVPSDFYDAEDVEELARLNIREARRRIKRDYRVSESTARRIAESMGVSTFTPRDEIEVGSGDETSAVHTGKFKEAFREAR